MATEYDDLDSLVRGKEQRGSKGGAYFSRWKKREPPVADVWLSCTRKPVTFYRHNFPEIISYEKKGETVTVTFSKQLSCFEDDAINNDRKREKRPGEEDLGLKNSGKRINAPRVCPVCLLIEWVRDTVLTGLLVPKDAVGDDGKPLSLEDRVARSLVTPLFAFDAKDDKEETVITAGGFASLYSEKQPDAWTRAMKRAKLSPMDTWKENGLAKLAYIFCVVDNDDPGAGVQKAIEPNLLGDKLVEELARIKESKGAKGDIYQHPFAVRWKSKPEQKQFDKRFDAFRLEDLELTPDIEALIRGPGPDISHDVAPFDPKSVLARMQGHCQVKGVPWNDIFAPGIATFEKEKGKAASGPTPEPMKAKRTRAEQVEESPREKMLTLKVEFDKLPEDADSTIQCGAKVDGGECPQKLPVSYKGDCPRCWILAHRPTAADAASTTRTRAVETKKVEATDDDSEIPF